ncbi:MAG: zinc ribbon domain-containing protein [Promethearchaeati archaeon SRVP18_Atabeyarchaeia-1]
MTLKTYSLNLKTRTQSEADQLRELLWHYRAKLNQILQDTWRTMKWKHQKIKGKKQVRLIPTHARSGGASRRELRDKYLERWSYAAHWVDSAIKTAYGIMGSWRKNYLKGRRKMRCPEAKRPFARVKQTLLKLEGDTLRITLSPHRSAHIDLSRRYFKLPDSVSSTGIGEPIITPTRVYLPIHSSDDGEEPRPVARKMAWDSNMLSMDGYSPQTGWVKIDTRSLASIHISSFEKRRNVQRKASKSKKVRRVLGKYRRRERNRAKKHQVEIARVVRSVAALNGFEALAKERLYGGSRLWNRRIARTDWRGVKRLAGGVELPPQYSSRMCSRCGWTNKDPRRRGSTVFECGNCGLRVDRQLNAAVNLYLRMVGVPHSKAWWDRRVLPSLVAVGGYAETGAERKGADELVRHLHEAVKPQIYMEYDRYADAYLPMPK